jgi:alpha-L-fucosidase
MKAGFIPPGDLMNQDLGSREKIAGAQSLIWYPSEVDVSIRPGWFWHGSENAEVKSPEKLLDIYFSSVGRNSLLLLNIPPDTTGLINQADIKSLQAWRNTLNNIFSENLAKNATVSMGGAKTDIQKITDQNDTTAWTPAKTDPMSIELKLQKTCDFNILLLQENITKGQRIEHFTLEAWVDQKWKKITEGTTVGYKRILRFPDVKTNKVRLRIDQSRLEPTLAEFGLYRYRDLAPTTGSPTEKE